MLAGMRRTCLLVFVVALGGCFDDCLGGGGGGGKGDGGSSSTRLDYDLVEATGEWSVTGSSKSGTCTSTTTSSKTTLTLKSPQKEAASYSSRYGLDPIVASNLESQRVPRTGTNSCGGTCPSSADAPLTQPAFFFVSTSPTMLMANAPDGYAFVPVLSSVPMPELCSGVSFKVSGAELRARPITIAELKSGRFVIEGSGESQIEGPAPTEFDPNPDTAEGTFRWSFKLVFQTADYDPAKAVTPPTFTLYDQCMADPAPSADELLAAKAAYVGGQDEVSLSADGCKKVSRTRNGTAETVRYVVTRGTKLTFDAASGTSRTEPDTLVPYERTLDGDVVHERFDDDGDGVFDRTIDETFSAGVWQSTESKVFAPGTMTPAERVTRTRVDATTAHVRFETDGVLEEEFDTLIRQESCVDSNSPTSSACTPPAPPTNCMGMVDSCKGQQLKDVTKQLADALKKGNACMKKAGFDSVQPQGQGLTMIATGKLNLLCSNNPCHPYGYYEPVANDNGTHDLMVNTVRDPAQVSRTLFHEMLHSDPRFDHDDKLDKLSSKLCKLQITDRTYACETMCFFPAASSPCSCVRCLNPKRYGPPPKEICRKCGSGNGFECPGRTGVRQDGSMGPVAQAVASYCERGSLLCDTKLECNRDCAPYGGGCKQLKSFCDDGGCN